MAEAEMQAEAQQIFFDSRAAGWENKCYPPQVRARLDELVSEFGLRPGTRILDVGTGPGVLYPYLLRALGDTGGIVAFDLSFNMIRQALKKNIRAGDLFFQGDALALALPDNTFDLVICFAAFPHFTDFALALRELARVAVPDAEVIIAHLLSREELAKHHGSLEAVAADILPEAEEMCELFVQAGLSRPEICEFPGRYLARGRKLKQTCQD